MIPSSAIILLIYGKVLRADVADDLDVHLLSGLMLKTEN